MEEEILSKLSSFTLTNEEDEAVKLVAEDFKLSKQECLLSVMGKIITQKGINLGGLRAAMELAWGYPKGLKVMEVGGGIYQFVFGNETDLIRVLAGSPWLFNNQLIVLQRCMEGVKPDGINFSFSPFWIQLRAIPLEFMSTDVGKKMMVGFGEVEDVVMAKLNGNQGRCLRVKVELDIKKPLPRGKKIYTANWEPVLVPFQYEKLPFFCHYCGVVGHDDRACLGKYNDMKAGILKENQYGGWLKASPVKASFRRRAEKRPEYPSAESSADGICFGKAKDYGKDLHNPGNSGEFKSRRRQLLWESAAKIDENKPEGVGQACDNSIVKDPTKPIKEMCASSEPILPLLESPVVDLIKAHSDGSIDSPVELMDEDHLLGKSTKAQNGNAIYLKLGTTALFEGQNSASDTLGKGVKGSARSKGMGPLKTSTTRGYKRKPRLDGKMNLVLWIIAEHLFNPTMPLRILGTMNHRIDKQISA
ncbi:hypothetical protein Vadar_000729 [Vaccinium darrowii]|uniref:Uncharacterized protein n=1 Tax=Vaccinium darrowii TaxID=229202 RepID=A0ACB7Z8T9_9ERIC|nr:hypothetical protein Vadar_000729 [Vaccinium darrowii]